MLSQPVEHSCPRTLDASRRSGPPPTFVPHIRTTHGKSNRQELLYGVALRTATADYLWLTEPNADAAVAKRDLKQIRRRMADLYELRDAIDHRTARGNAVRVLRVESALADYRIRLAAGQHIDVAAVIDTIAGALLLAT